MAIPHSIFEDMRAVCAAAWRRGLLSGFNGNVSVRMDSACCVTRSGAAKGDLTPDDVAAVDIATGTTLEGATPSSELSMHLEIYRCRADARAVVHTHPRHLLALELRVPPERFLEMPLFEAQQLRRRLGQAPAVAPGTSELALAVAREAEHRDAVWMSRHGLVCHAADLKTALALSEELDHLAAVQLLAER